jgi:hypothetical protein
MKTTLLILTAALLMAFAEPTVQVSSGTGAWAANACVQQCRNNGWSTAQCRKYCESRPEGGR